MYEQRGRAMRYLARPYTEATNALGNITRTLAADSVRCAMEARTSTETSALGDKGVYVLTTYRLTFWHGDAEAAGIVAGSVIRVEGVDMRIVSAKPGGVGLRQYLICTAEHAEDV